MAPNWVMLSSQVAISATCRPKNTLQEKLQQQDSEVVKLVNQSGVNSAGGLILDERKKELAISKSFPCPSKQHRLFPGPVLCHLQVMFF